MDSVDGSNIKRESRLAVFEHLVERKKPKRVKKFHAHKFADESSVSESELVIDENNAGESSSVRKEKRIDNVKLSMEKLNLECEWDDCNENDETFSCFRKFITHITAHASLHGEAVCLWNDCPNPELSSTEFLTKHLAYHGYLSKLANIGENIVKRNNLPHCKLKKEYNIDASINGYTCQWSMCLMHFDTICEYFDHIAQHINGNPTGKAKNADLIPCGWSGCNMKFKTRYYLAEHVRIHTKEKIIGCPTCFTLFAAKTKYCHHRSRQMENDLRGYQCSQCLKLFASEVLLSEHMRCHINQYKCNMCDMTCAKPSILAKHYRYKHLNERLCICQECGKSFVEKCNLKTHLLTHKKENKFACRICEFSCRSKVGINSHYARIHDKGQNQYECHVCKKQFSRGNNLTSHLMKAHNFHWPSGHSRFRYRKDQDGIFRLQTVRYESLAVTEEMLCSASVHNTPAVTYNVILDTNEEQGYKVTVVGDNPNETDPELGQEGVEDDEELDVDSPNIGGRRVILTLDDIDIHGNVVKSTVLQEDFLSDNEATILSIGETQLTSQQEINVLKPEEDKEIHYFSKEVIMQAEKKMKFEIPNKS